MKIKCKYIIFTLLLVFICSGGLSAAFFSDIYGTSVTLGDQGTLNGAGAGLSWTLQSRYILPELYPFADFSFASSVEDKNEPAETVRVYLPVSAGMSYRHRLFADRVFATASGGAGLYYFKIEGPKKYGSFIDFSQTERTEVWGPQGSINLGFLFMCSQKFSLFAQAGYTMAYFNDPMVKEGLLSGYCFSAGLRMAVSGNNRSFLDD